MTSRPYASSPRRWMILKSQSVRRWSPRSHASVGQKWSSKVKWSSSESSGRGRAMVEILPCSSSRVLPRQLTVLTVRGLLRSGCFSRTPAIVSLTATWPVPAALWMKGCVRVNSRHSCKRCPWTSFGSGVGPSALSTASHAQSQASGSTSGDCIRREVGRLAARIRRQENGATRSPSLSRSHATASTAAAARAQQLRLRCPSPCPSLQQLP